MTDRPILFSAPMVRALLEGRKTQTRRLIKPTAKQVAEWNPDLSICPSARIVPEYVAFDHPGGGPYTCVPLHFAVGDRLWVKETWRTSKVLDDLKPTELDDNRIWYEADRDNCDQHGKTRVSLFMRRWMSRLTLLVTDVRVERLQHCSENDAIAEGVHALRGDGPNHFTVEVPGWLISGPTAVETYRLLWNWINGEGAWEANPWVVAISFTVEQRNIDT